MAGIWFNIDSAKTEIACAWYLEIPPGDGFGKGGNFIAMVLRDKGEPWQCTIRSRQYVDDLFTRDTKDIRQGYRVTPHPGEPDDVAKQRLVDTAQKMFFTLRDKSEGRLTIINDFRDTDHFIEIWSSQPWAHTEIVPLPPEGAPAT